MKRLWAILICSSFWVGTAAPDGEKENGWKTYRSEKFGYEISYPGKMEFAADLEGASGNLLDIGTGRILARFEVWPPSECLVPMKERTETDVREIGIQRSKALTQADGPLGSSYCGDPLTVREIDSAGGIGIYRLELSCINEEYPALDDEEQIDGGASGTIDVAPITTFVGKKGPTFFVDISQPWLKRVLMADPVGSDPRQQKISDPIVPVDLSNILTTVATFPVPKPRGVCIEDLQER